MHVIGEETSQRLDVIPVQFQVIVTHRPKYACRACEEAAVVQAHAPERLIKGGLPAEAMVAFVLVTIVGCASSFSTHARSRSTRPSRRCSIPAADTAPASRAPGKEQALVLPLKAWFEQQL
jgi:hypothetical protein